MDSTTVKELLSYRPNVYSDSMTTEKPAPAANEPRSTWHFDCPCGKHITSFDRTTTCADCGRILVIEWPEVDR